VTVYLAHAAAWNEALVEDVGHAGLWSRTMPKTLMTLLRLQLLQLDAVTPLAKHKAVS
jgi:hypothetical protein